MTLVYLTLRMEDWYLALLGASAAKPDTNDVFAKEDMKYLVDSIAAEADPIPMRWLNAMLGRAFFGVAKTAALEQVSRPTVNASCH